MTGRKCRPSCANIVPDGKAFCPRCWRAVPVRVQNAIYRSWGQVRRDPEHLYAHVQLILDAQAALEGERPWKSVAPS